MASYLIFDQNRFGGAANEGIGLTDNLLVNRDHIKYVSYIDDHTFGLMLNSGTLISLGLFTAFPFNPAANSAPEAIDDINNLLTTSPSGQHLYFTFPETTQAAYPPGVTRIGKFESSITPPPLVENLGDLNDVFRDVSDPLPRNNSLMLGGYSSSLGTIGDGLIYIGNPDTNSGYTSSGGSYSVVVGMDAGKNGLASNMVIIGNEAGNGGVSGTPIDFGIGGTESVVIGAKAVEGDLGALTRSVCLGYRVCSSGFTDVSFDGTNFTSLQNVVIGHDAGPTGSPTTMSYATMIGASAGTGQENTVHNTFIGARAGRQVSTGSNNSCIGYDAQASVGTVSNEFTLGNSSVATLRCAVTSITSLSDERDKKDITDLEYGLDFIESLQPKQFTWDNRPDIQTVEELDENGDLKEVEKEIESANKGKKDFGFIAQDVQPLDNDVLRLVYDENPDKLEMSYGKLVPILVKAVKELSDKVKALEAK